MNGKSAKHPGSAKCRDCAIMVYLIRVIQWWQEKLLDMKHRIFRIRPFEN